jgi:hypothetical protein
LLSESPTGTTTYTDAQGRAFTVGASEVVERRPAASSLMPENLVHALTPREFRDLIAYLRRSDESLGR